jgi:ABC-2 type transport system ATP-binding protein
MSEAIIAVSGLRKRFGTTLALDGMSFSDHLVIVGRGRVIADTSVRELIAATSGDRVTLCTASPAVAAAVLDGAGAAVVATGRDTVILSGLPSEKVVALLGASAVPFS